MSAFHLAFSGHRPSDQPGRTLEELEATRPLIDFILANSCDFAAQQQKSLTLHSGIAEGADRIFCRAALNLGIPITLHLPLPLTEFKQDFSSEETWQLSKSIIDEVELLYGENNIILPPKNIPRPQCYAETNTQMLNIADALCVIWNQLPAGGTGGTQEMWMLANKQKIKKIMINPITQKIMINELDLAS